MPDTTETFRPFEFLYPEDGVEKEEESEFREELESEICLCDLCHHVLLDGNFCECQCDACDCIFCNECKRPIAGDSYEEHIKKCGGGEK